MKKIKKIAASLMAVAAITTSMVGINASAAMNEYPAEIVVDGDTGTLKNNTGIPRDGVVIYSVYKRSNGALMGSDSAYGTIPAGGSISAHVYGYTSTTLYYHEASGTLYNGAVYQSGGWLTVSDNDL